MMWELRGDRYATQYESGESDILIAKFTSEGLAAMYLQNSRLKQPKRGQKYKSASLASYYDSVWIEEEREVEYIQINPTL